MSRLQSTKAPCSASSLLAECDAEPRATTIQDVAAQIIRRTAEQDGRASRVVRVSYPPTIHERLQLMAARLARRPIVAMPHKCKTAEDWLAGYARSEDG